MSMRGLMIFLLSTVLIHWSWAQQYTISGYVEDFQTGERLIGAAVYDGKNQRFGTFTNEYGFFSLTLPAGKIVLKASFVGYKPWDTVINLTSDIELTIRLHSATQLEEIVVTGYKAELKNAQTGKITVPMRTIQNLPIIFGEQDLLKALQLLPGVQAGAEGMSGIYVRGGTPDQNLILLDGVPVYNVTHMGGIFSIFTPEAIKDVTLYKSGFPARFGGRLSSVIDVRMKDGNMKKLTGSFSLGIISSKFTLEGPLKKDKASFVITARRTYYDLLITPIISLINKNSEEYYEDPLGKYYYKFIFRPGYYFYDFYTKLNYKITDRDRLFISFYSGLDKIYFYIKDSTYLYDKSQRRDYYYSYITNFTTAWGNRIAALRWNHNFSGKLFWNTTLTYSKFLLYLHNEEIERDLIESKLTSFYDYKNYYDLYINDFALRSDLSYQPNVNHYIRTGIEAIYHKFLPGKISYEYNELWLNEYYKYDTAFGYVPLYAPELSFYIEDEFSLGKIFKFNAGARMSLFDVQKRKFYSIEPRLSMRAKLSSNLSFKVSYARMTQYIHMLANNTFVLPLDMWLPSTPKVTPELSQQIAGGIWWLAPNNISVSLEGYYKWMNNLIEYKEGKSWFSFFDEDKSVAETWENIVTQGKGYAYGIDLLVKKDFGKLNGWFGTSLAWSYRQFPEINFGKPFPFKYDRRLSIDIALNYKFSDRFTLGTVWTYGSGRPITVPLGEEFSPVELHTNDYYFFDIYQKPKPQGILYYGGRNGYRLPAYHRLDISFNLSKQKKHGVRTWSLGIYNAYNHINPFFAFVHDKSWYLDSSTPHYVLRVISIFQFMPFVSYKFTWK